MSSFRITRTIVSLALALAGLALALPLVAHATSVKEQPGPPLVKTKGVGRVSGTSAVLEGTIDPRTFTTTYYFEYGPTAAYGKQTASGTLEGGPTATITRRVNETATGFQGGYYYRLVATNSAGPGEGLPAKYVPKPSKAIRKKSEFVLPKSFAPTPLGGTFILAGTLTGTGNAGRAIVLQATPYPYTAPYANVGGPILTGAAGAFSFHVAALSTSAKFRVATVAAPGALPLLSPVVPEQVTVRVILKARSAGKKGLVRLYGTVTPAEVGAHVFIELERIPKPKREKSGKIEKPEREGKRERAEREPAPTFATKFDTVVKRATRSISRFSVVVSIADAGHYRAFVQVKPGPVASGHSGNVLLDAPAKKTKRKNRKA
jgi:hypothetical protein